MKPNRTRDCAERHAETETTQHKLTRVFPSPHKTFLGAQQKMYKTVLGALYKNVSDKWSQQRSV